MEDSIKEKLALRAELELMLSEALRQLEKNQHGAYLNWLLPLVTRRRRRRSSHRRIAATDWTTARRQIEDAASKAQRFKLVGRFTAAVEAYGHMVQLGGVLPGRMQRAALCTTIQQVCGRPMPQRPSQRVLFPGFAALSSRACAAGYHREVA